MDTLFSVKDKIVIITGGLGQIGLEFVKEFYKRGSKVVALSRSASLEKAREKLGDEISDSNRFLVFPVDIQKKEQINSVLDKIENIWGTVDVLINNAGLDTKPNAPASVSGPFEFFPEEVFREVVSVNLVGTFLMTQAVGARMIKAKKPGSIINVGSTYGMVSPVQDIYAYRKEQTGIPFTKPVAYSTAKSGLYNFTRYCATYWAKKGIRVNTFTPAGVYSEKHDETFSQNYKNRIPIGRFAMPDEYNGAMIFLASDASKYMTGANLVMDGGWTAW